MKWAKVAPTQTCSTTTVPIPATAASRPIAKPKPGSTDGIATTISGDGGGNGGRYHNLDEMKASSTSRAD